MGLSVKESTGKPVTTGTPGQVRLFYNHFQITYLNPLSMKQD